MSMLVRAADGPYSGSWWVKESDADFTQDGKGTYEICEHDEVHGKTHFRLAFYHEDKM